MPLVVVFTLTAAAAVVALGLTLLTDGWWSSTLSHPVVDPSGTGLAPRLTAFAVLQSLVALAVATVGVGAGPGSAGFRASRPPCSAVSSSPLSWPVTTWSGDRFRTAAFPGESSATPASGCSARGRWSPCPSRWSAPHWAAAPHWCGAAMDGAGPSAGTTAHPSRSWRVARVVRLPAVLMVLIVGVAAVGASPQLPQNEVPIDQSDRLALPSDLGAASLCAWLPSDEVWLFKTVPAARTKKEGGSADLVGRLTWYGSVLTHADDPALARLGRAVVDSTTTSDPEGDGRLHGAG
ncbi:hypothetical protein ACFQ0M_05035 [Kitasatospora aburaviensis]